MALLCHRLTHAGAVKKEVIEQQRVAFELADAAKGREMRVLVDGAAVDGLTPARHAGQAPMVDSVTFVEHSSAVAGDFLDIRCTGRHDYDLVGVPTTVALPTLSSHEN